MGRRLSLIACFPDRLPVKHASIADTTLVIEVEQAGRPYQLLLWLALNHRIAKLRKP